MKHSLAKNTFIEISIQGRGTSNQKQLIEWFLAQKIPLSDVAAGYMKGRFKYSFYTRSVPRVRKLRQAFRTTRLKGMRIQTKILGPHDWYDKWKMDYHTGPVGKRFTIVPLWERKKFKKSGKRMPIFLDPHGAFGSGTHETTRLVIRLMEPYSGKFDDVIDLGAGTGILSIAAWKLGARSVTGIDHDGSSVKTARENYTVHNQCLNGRFQVRDLTRCRMKRKYHLVCANLFSKILLENKTSFLGFVAPGGLIIVSGILKRNFKAFLKGFSDRRFRRIQTVTGRRWGAALYQRRSPK